MKIFVKKYLDEILVTESLTDFKKLIRTAANSERYCNTRCYKDAIRAEKVFLGIFHCLKMQVGIIIIKNYDCLTQVQQNLQKLFPAVIAIVMLARQNIRPCRHRDSPIHQLTKRILR